MIPVVVPAYNEENTLHLCLDALVSQTIKDEYEIIVVDNNSTDKTSEIIKRYEKNTPVRYVLEKQKGAGAARSRGFDEARGEMIFTTDADTIVPTDWLERLTPPLKRDGVVAVTSPCTIDEESKLKQRVFVLAEHIAIYGHKLLKGHVYIGGFSFGVKKDAYIKAGKLNKDLPMLDDVDLSQRISKEGDIVLVKDLYVTSSNRRYKDGLLKGLVSYLRPFFEMTYLGKKAVMEDVR